MPDHQEQPQAADTSTAVKTPVQTSQAKREATFKAREAKAAKRFAASHGQSEEPARPKEETGGATSEEASQANADAGNAEPSKEEKKPADIDKRHAIAERREKRVAQREAKAQDRERKLSTAEHNLQVKYGDPDAAKQAYDKGSFHEAAKYMQRIFGDDFATITQKIARATAGLSPEKLKELEERDTFAREKREFEARKRKEEEEKTKGATREKAIAHVADKCKGHDALKLKRGSELVLAELERNFDESTKTFKVTFKQAADNVLAEKLAEAEALGLRRPTAQVVDKKPDAPVAKPAAKPPAPAVPQKNGARMSFEERHANAGRLLAKRRAT